MKRGMGKRKSVICGAKCGGFFLFTGESPLNPGWGVCGYIRAPVVPEERERERERVRDETKSPGFICPGLHS